MIEPPEDLVGEICRVTLLSGRSFASRLVAIVPGNEGVRLWFKGRDGTESSTPLTAIKAIEIIRHRKV